MKPSLSLTKKNAMDEASLLKRIAVDPKILCGKPIIRGRRLATDGRSCPIAAP